MTDETWLPADFRHPTRVAVTPTHHLRPIRASDVDIDLAPPTVSIRGVKAGKTYPKKKSPTCVGADTLSGLASCTITQVKKGKKYVVTATATDQVGHVATTTLTYKVKKKPSK